MQFFANTVQSDNSRLPGRLAVNAHENTAGRGRLRIVLDLHLAKRVTPRKSGPVENSCLQSNVLLKQHKQGSAIVGRDANSPRRQRKRPAMTHPGLFSLAERRQRWAAPFSNDQELTLLTRWITGDFLRLRIRNSSEQRVTNKDGRGVSLRSNTPPKMAAAPLNEIQHGSLSPVFSNSRSTPSAISLLRLPS